MELTAERSLEIITEQLEKSRRAVSKDTGEWLFVTGLIAMIMSDSSIPATCWIAPEIPIAK